MLDPGIVNLNFYTLRQGFQKHLEVRDAVIQLADVHRSRRWRERWVPEARTPRGGPGACPAGKFVNLDSLKCNFLRSLDRNWVTGKVF